ncbi:hypothetical protein [Actinomadura fulvescens]|uniref:hypothetical protein n=1 Tax=Actinomadura fulvescens TaxID=46160 RepID=UPI0031D3A4CF
MIGDGALRPMSGRQVGALRLPPHRTSTMNLQAIYPWQADAGLGALGPLVGHNILGGGSFCFDPWDWYDAGVITNPNGMTFGEIGSRKSTEVKTRVARAFEFGRGAFVTDPKDEYTDLAHFLGYEPIYLGPGRAARLNPFDFVVGGSEDPTAVQDRHLSMLQALGTGVLRRDLTEAEMTLCRISIAELTDGQLRRAVDGAGQPTVAASPGDRMRVPILPEVVDVMQHPSSASIAELPLDKGELRVATADLIMGFQRLVDGDLKGMFDGPTTVERDPRGRFLTVNLSAVLAERREALPLVRICASAWLQAAISAHRMRRYNIADEAWADMTLGTLRWHQSRFKLARQHLISNWLVMHKPADLMTAGDAGSELDRLAMSLIADAGVIVFYRQKPQQIPLCQSYFGVTDKEAEWLGRLHPGQALWWIGGDRSLVIQHIRSPTEATFTNTDFAPISDTGPQDFAPDAPTPDGPGPGDHGVDGHEPDAREHHAPAVDGAEPALLTLDAPDLRPHNVTPVQGGQNTQPRIEPPSRAQP